MSRVAISGNAGGTGTLTIASPNTNTDSTLTLPDYTGTFLVSDSSGGTANGVVYLNASKVPTSGSALVFDGTNLGIGTSSPQAKLQVIGTIAVTGAQSQLWNGATGTYTTWQYNGTSIGDLGSGNQTFSGGATGDFGVSSRSGNLVFGTGNTERMRLDSSGNLGIGTSSPSAKLHVSSASDDILRLTATAPYLSFYNGATRTGYIRSNTSGTFGIVSEDASTPMTFYTAGAEAMRISTSGNLGLGVTPSAWNSAIKSLEIAQVGNGISGQAASQVSINCNAYYSASSWTYSITGRPASVYQQTQGTHVWNTAPSGTAGNAITFTPAMTLDASGNLYVGKTADSTSTAGCQLNANGFGALTRSGGNPQAINRLTNDGTLVSFQQDSTEEGTISVSGTTVSYNAFAGSHWSQLQDGSKPEILRGTVMESIDELCEWPNEPTSERLCRVKVSDTEGSKKVYGVFMDWDHDWTATNDMLVTSLGAFICRVNGAVAVQEGDLLESNGDGTARVQADDIMRSSTIGKVTCTVKTHEYEDGSYCVPTVLYCG